MKILSAALSLCLALTSLAAGKKANIIYIVADDLGYGELGCYGPKEIPTPNIDSLATNGVRMTSAYVSAPVCSPTRAGFLTGRYQQRFGHELNPGTAKASPEFGLPVTEKTIGDRLKPLGYTTAWIGKSHLGFEPQFHPMKRGFDEFFGFLGGAHPYFGEAKDNPILRGTEPVTESEYLTSAFAREAVSFIDRNREKPFFLYLAFNGVHNPMQAPKDLVARFKGAGEAKRRSFCAMLTALDDAVGTVLKKVREAQLEENTLIVFFSDNGGPTQQTTCRNTPLRGYKGQTLEGGIRVPFLMQWKSNIPAGKEFTAPVSALDLLPTAVTAAGGNVEADWKLDGVDLLPFVAGSAPGVPHETLYWRFGDQAAIRHGDWKLVRYAIGRSGRLKSEWELYDLAEDIGEARNRANEEPDRRKELEDLWNTWNAQLESPKWTKTRGRARAKAAPKNAKPAAVEKDGTITPLVPNP